MYVARIYIKLKESILDPQGQAVIHALHNLGHRDATDVRIGKYIEVTVDAPEETSAAEKIRLYCDTLLANPVIETYEFKLEPAPK
jgi:phosphoribosylformylglycinamidine synthase subunit PurS